MNQNQAEVKSFYTVEMALELAQATMTAKLDPADPLLTRLSRAWWVVDHWEWGDLSPWHWHYLDSVFIRTNSRLCTMGWEPPGWRQLYDHDLPLVFQALGAPARKLPTQKPIKLFDHEPDCSSRTHPQRAGHARTVAQL